MALGDLVRWPLRSISNLISFCLSLIISVIQLPFKLLHSVLRSIWNRFKDTLVWLEPKILYLKSTKPFVYILPSHQPADKDEKEREDLSLVVPSTPPVLGVTAGKDKRDLTSRSLLRRRPPTHSPRAKCEEDSASMSTLIQELLEFSKHHKSPSHSAVQSHPKESIDGDESEQVLQLIKDLQDFATSGKSTKAQPTVEKEKDPELDQLLTDLNVLESYVSHFLDEQQGGVSGPHPPTVDGQAIMVADTSSLETITEEELSKECSPSYLGSPPPSLLARGNVNKSGGDDHTHTVPDSDELQYLLRQIADTIHQTERNVEEQKEKKKENRHKFIETQHELQEMMDSLDPSQITAATRPEPQLLYDTLDPQSPLYSKPNKSKTTPKITTPTQHATPTSLPSDPIDEQIYDSIALVNTPIDETPPPIPMKRTSSGTSTSSLEHSPKGERRRRHSSGDEDCCSKHGRHHRSRKHKRHSSRRSSDSHCCCHDDHSPDRCGHSHKPRSRERHHHRRHSHAHHRSRSESEEDTPYRRRAPRESSGYESQDFESPYPRSRVTRSNSDVTTPKEVRRGFLGGLFSRKSTTSLNSLSTKSEPAGDNFSVSSYKM